MPQQAGVQGQPPEWLFPSGRTLLPFLTAELLVSPPPLEVTGHTKQMRKSGFIMSYTQGQFLSIGQKLSAVVFLIIPIF